MSDGIAHVIPDIFAVVVIEGKLESLGNNPLLGISNQTKTKAGIFSPLPLKLALVMNSYNK